MAKDKQRAIAKDYFVSLRKSQKDISQLLGVSEQTLTRWANQDNWKAARDAKLNTSIERAEAIKDVISLITTRRLEVFKEIEDAKKLEDKQQVLILQRESAALSQEVAMQTKALEKMEREHKISLAVYLEVMDDIFKALAAYDSKIHMMTLDFQDSHLSTISLKIG
jgi:predicted transcriptional regulator